MESVGERLESILHRVQRLSGLVDTLLDVSRLGAGGLQLSIEPVDLAEVAQTVQDRMAIELAAAGCAVELDLPEPVVGEWDRHRLEQVVENLLANAMKFGRGRPIRVRVAAQSRLARLSVSDQGVGIAPEDQAGIFERFQRAGTARGFGGFGLGLWIARQIVEALGGTIDVESGVGRGSTFTVTLPRERN